MFYISTMVGIGAAAFAGRHVYNFAQQSGFSNTGGTVLAFGGAAIIGYFASSAFTWGYNATSGIFGGGSYNQNPANVSDPYNNTQPPVAAQTQGQNVNPANSGSLQPASTPAATPQNSGLLGWGFGPL